ncbi:Muramidase-2 [Lentibacillus sp. JNUCC-1]|uniref:3D domain-containing protein n=1 Tax=Lentibacillus sp. JNUCC-1 TaxID=2654513 RepID=UPI0012E8F359|nr:3D domain-containing protein [Lentibacillus sp. JNUCC-1]MUV37489.1 Muramidase-2 [Lentibacillus sp. JNUCC-1]
MRKLVALCATLFIVATGTVTASAQVYEVEKGDSLWKIANENNMSVDRLIEINNLKTTVIQPKQSITLYDSYQVEKGDTLSAISKTFDVTVEDLMEWNDLSSDLILIGQELTIKDGAEAVKKDTASKAKRTEQQSNDDKVAAKQAVNTRKAETVSNSSAKASQPTEQKADGKTISVQATAYTAKCDGCSGVTYTGLDLNQNPNAKVIAVDPSVIPLGTKVYVEGYGYATAADIGGAIKGNRIDIHVPTKKEAYSWGVREVNVTIVE